MARSRCSNDAIRNLSPSLGPIFPVLAGFSFYGARLASRDLRLPSFLLRSQRKAGFPFPSPVKVAGLSVPDQAQVTSPTVS